MMEAIADFVGFFCCIPIAAAIIAALLYLHFHSQGEIKGAPPQQAEQAEYPPDPYFAA